jgi:hypothetical protein
MKTFVEWLNEGVGKKVLLLVHPDVICENGMEKAVEYCSKLREHVGKFDYVISHMFNPLTEFNKDAHEFIKACVEEVSDVAIIDTNYGCSYGKELPDYLVENPNSVVYIAGGYESNCVWLSYLKLMDDLGWLVKDTGAKVIWYKPLLFQPHWEEPRQYEPKKFADWEKNRGDFHPGKVSFDEYNAPRSGMKSRWSIGYKKKINCSHPKGFSQKNYCKRQKRGGGYKS